jgi:hypothetical protein
MMQKPKPNSYPPRKRQKGQAHATERAGVLPELPVLLPVLGTQPEYGLHQLAEVYISKT